MSRETLESEVDAPGTNSHLRVMSTIPNEFNNKKREPELTV